MSEKPTLPEMDDENKITEEKAHAVCTTLLFTGSTAAASKSSGVAYRLIDKIKDGDVFPEVRKQYNLLKKDYVPVAKQRTIDEMKRAGYTDAQISRHCKIRVKFLT
jgi:hypothetical protein